MQGEQGGLFDVWVGGRCLELCDMIWVSFFRFVVAKEGWGASAVGLNIYILFLLCECRARGSWLQEVFMVAQAVACVPAVLAVPRVCVGCQNLHMGVQS